MNNQIFQLFSFFESQAHFNANQYITPKGNYTLNSHFNIFKLMKIINLT